MSNISYEVDNDGVAVVTWDLENRSMNVLNTQSVNEYRDITCLLYTSPSPRDVEESRMPSSA